MGHLQTLMAAIRRAAPTPIWSMGVSWCRAGAVRVPARATLTQETFDVQVVDPATRMAVVVTLWPEDEDWSCVCRATTEVCAHTAAAIIACNQAQSGRAPVPTAFQGHIAYHFMPGPDGLTLARYVVQQHGREPFMVPLRALVQQGAQQVVAQAHDQAVDTLLVGRMGTVLPQPVLARVLKALEGAPHVHVREQACQVGAPRSLYVLKLRQRPHGALGLQLGRDTQCQEHYAQHAGLFEGVLRLLLPPPMPAPQQRALQAGVTLEPDRAQAFFGDVLPRWTESLTVDWGDVHARRPIAVAPSLHLALQLDPGTDETGPTLSVLPTLVYGDPPMARVHQDTLHALGAQVPKRLPSAEAALVRALDAALAVRPGHRVSAHGPQGVALAEAVRKLRQGPAACQLADPDHALGAFAVRGTLRPRLALEDGHFEMDFTLEPTPGAVASAAGGARATWEAVDAAARGERPLVPLLGGGFAALPSDFLQQHGDTLALLLDARAAQAGAQRGAPGPGGLPPWALPHLGALAEAIGTPLPRAYAEPLAALRGGSQHAAAGAETQPYTLPPGWTLRPYQAEGIAFLRARLALGLGALLADDMGLGKTLQALCAQTGPTLVVAPTSVLHNWAKEAARLLPQTSVNIYHGPKRELDPQAGLTLTTYGVLRQDTAALCAQQFETLILDEAQTIKNGDSQVAQAAFAVSGSARGRIAMTGTPVENRLDELYSQCHFLNPGLLGTRAHFEATFCAPIALGASPEAQNRPDLIARGRAAGAALRARLAPIVLRRTKAQVAQDLPPRTDVVLRCELTPLERGVYQAVQASARAQVVKLLGTQAPMMQALEALLRLRQAACHPGLVPGQSAPTSSKVALMMQTLQQALELGHRALIFSQWTSFLDRIAPHLRAASIPFCRLDGSTADRQAVVDAFSADGGPPVMLLSLRAGGVGLNLTAADHVFLMDPWWNPAAEDQAADRAHRIGQKRPVIVHRLIAQETVEEQILALQAHKRALADAALEGDGAAAPALGLTREDILALVGA